METKNISSQVKICRFPECPSKIIRGKGLCQKHRIWLKKGYIDEKCTIIKPPRTRIIYSPDDKCKIAGCDKKPRGHWRCYYHEHSYRVGRHDELGKPTKKVKKCKVCDNTKNIVKGFCQAHYMQMRKGVIDQDGNEIREIRRYYAKINFCRFKGCTLKPRAKGFCKKHHSRYLRGTMNLSGVRIKKPKTAKPPIIRPTI